MHRGKILSYLRADRHQDGLARQLLLADWKSDGKNVVNVTTGAVAQRIDYDAWGKLTGDTTPGYQAFGFAGGLYDGRTKLTHFGAREYDAEAGRWTMADPILFWGGDANVFAYAADDPVNRIDPMGLDDSWPPPSLYLVHREPYRLHRACTPQQQLIGAGFARPSRA